MITELLLIAAAGVIDPMDMSGHKYYPSGNLEEDKYYKYAPESSKLAKLALPQEIIDDSGKVIPAGQYLAGMSLGKGQILIFDGQKELYTLTVSDIGTMVKRQRISTATFYSDNNGECFIILSKNNLRVRARVKLNRD